MKKLLISICIATAVAYTNALPENIQTLKGHNQEASSLSLIIKSELPFELENVRIKLDTGTWIPLKDIYRGKNTFTIDGKSNSVRGLIQVQEPNGQFMNAAFLKKSTDSVISINIAPDYDKNAIDLLNNRGAASNTVAMKAFNENSSQPLTFFSPVASSTRNFSYFTLCSKASVIGAFVTCDINFDGDGIQLMGIGAGASFSGGSLIGSTTTSREIQYLIATGQKYHGDFLFISMTPFGKLSFEGRSGDNKDELYFVGGGIANGYGLGKMKFHFIK